MANQLISTKGAIPESPASGGIPSPNGREQSLPFSLRRMRMGRIKEISVFVDESGSYDSDESSSLYYMVCLVFHDQDCDISNEISKLESAIATTGLEKGHCIHTTPLIRRENEYEHEYREKRKALFFKMLTFVRRADVSFKCFYVDKQFIDDAVAIHDKLCRDIKQFLSDNVSKFDDYAKIKIYYDNGQDQVKKVLEDAFSIFASRTEFVPEVTPNKYRLFQAADFICTLELIRLRIANGAGLNKSEAAFFGNARLFRRNVLAQLSGKNF